jgi:CXXX repeat modification system protein
MPKQNKRGKIVKSPAKRQDAKQNRGADAIVVGKVGPKERDEIRALFERRNGLLELVQSLAQNGSGLLDNTVFYEKVIADLGRTKTRFQKWWDDKAKAYGWQGKPGWQWSIDFDTCQISLNKQNKGD